MLKKITDKINAFLAAAKSIEIPISKTTLNGGIAFFIAMVPLLMTTPNLGVSPKIAAWLSLALGAARWYVGWQQADADRVLAKVKGQTGVQEVAAHPVPNDPNAKAVIPK